MFKKIVSKVIIAALVLSLSMVTACGNKDTATKSDSQATVSETQASTSSAAPTETKKPLEGRTVTFSTFTQWYNTIGGLKEGLAKCEEITGAKIQVNVYPDDQFYNVINTKLASGETEDFFAFYASISVLHANDKLEPLDGPWLETLNKDTIPYLTRKSDNKLVGVPYNDAQCLAAIYNKEIFQKAGIKAPIKNYTEFMAACEAIKKTGVTPVYLPNKDNWTAQIIMLSSLNNLFANDTSLVDKIKKNQVKYQDIPQLVELSNRAISLKDKGYLNDNYMSADFNMALEAVANGTAGMFFGGSWLYEDVAKKYPDKVANTGMTPVSLTDDRVNAVVNVSASAFYVAEDSKNKDAAKVIINTFLSDEVLNGVLADKFTSFPLYSNFKNKMNPWIAELKGYVDSGIPAEEQFNDRFFRGIDCGNVGDAYQAIFAGKDLKTALEDWHKDMLTKNHAKGIEGF